MGKSGEEKMSEIKTVVYTGGPAYPVSGTLERGLTMRDYFAAKWLQGWMACPKTDAPDMHDAAKWAYEMADAMLKAREVGHG